jgi:hypothetical protein
MVKLPRLTELEGALVEALEDQLVEDLFLLLRGLLVRLLEPGPNFGCRQAQVLVLHPVGVEDVLGLAFGGGLFLRGSLRGGSLFGRLEGVLGRRAKRPAHLVESACGGAGVALSGVRVHRGIGVW